jgi:hypothetical protein
MRFFHFLVRLSGLRAMVRVPIVYQPCTIPVPVRITDR